MAAYHDVDAEIIAFEVTEEERALIARAAAVRGVTIEAFVEEATRQALERLVEAGTLPGPVGPVTFSPHP